jgi:hypothetical protein
MERAQLEGAWNLGAVEKILIPVNDQLDAQFFFSCMFISILYMFRATWCSSSGESIVSIQVMVCVTLCRCHSLNLTCIPDAHLHRVTYTRSCIDTIDYPDEHEVARNM